jgi:hypothetical protein
MDARPKTIRIPVRQLMLDVLNAAEWDPGHHMTRPNLVDAVCSEHGEEIELTCSAFILTGELHAFSFFIRPRVLSVPKPSREGD